MTISLDNIGHCSDMLSWMPVSLNNVFFNCIGNSVEVKTWKEG